MPVEAFAPRNAAGTELIRGAGAAAELGAFLERRGLRRAMVVSGPGTAASGTVGEVIAGLGSLHVGTYTGTDPRKSIESMMAGVEVFRATRPDVVIGVGGGASLDAARMISLLAADGRSAEQLLEAALAGPTELPARPADTRAEPADTRAEPADTRAEPADTRAESADTAAAPAYSRGGVAGVVLVPTTLAGAELAGGTAVRLVAAEGSPTGEPVRVRGFLEPMAVVYDPLLVDRAPRELVLASAMNGLDKGLDTLYSRGTSAVGRAAAVRGITLLRRWLPRFAGGDTAATEKLIEGIILVQFDRRLSVLHAIAHGFSRRYARQQGLIHAAIAPAVVEAVLEVAPRACAGFAEAWDVQEQTPRGIGAAIVELRDGLGLPRGLGALFDADEVRVGDVAVAVCADPLLAAAPEGFGRDPDTIASVITRAW